jgi:outer membrane protein TolC
MIGRRITSLAVLCCVALLISACATYRPEPLPTSADLKHDPAALTIKAERLRIPGLQPHPLDLSKGLDMTTTVMLAVLNNPALKAAHAHAHVASAELFNAGLLPDPKLDGEIGFPIGGGDNPPNSYFVGLSQELRSIFTRSTAKEAASAKVRSVNLEILWQEWQVAEKARMLFVRRQSETELRAVYAEVRDLYQRRYRRDWSAVHAGDLTISQAATDLAALNNAENRLRKLDREADGNAHELNALLGLTPDVTLRLAGNVALPVPSVSELQAAQTQLPSRRPDLLALQVGYQSQEAALHRAVLEQFPSIKVGVFGARDTDNVRTVGIGVSLNLPLFNRNRGNIAIQQATRDQLRAEYQARLDEAIGEAHRLWRATELLHNQLDATEKRLPELENLVSEGQASYTAGNLDDRSYIALRTHLLDARSEAIQLKESLGEARVALETLLGMSLDGD